MIQGAIVYLSLSAQGCSAGMVVLNLTSVLKAAQLRWLLESLTIKLHA